MVDEKDVILGAVVATTIEALSPKFSPVGIEVVAKALLLRSFTVPTTYDETVRSDELSLSPTIYVPDNVAFALDVVNVIWSLVSNVTTKDEFAFISSLNVAEIFILDPKL